MNVVLRAAPCIHIADHISRKSESAFGALLGVHVGSKLVICEAFDLKELDALDTQGLIDMGFLQKKLQLHIKVSPRLSLAGIYSTKGNNVPEQSFYSQFTDSNVNVPEIYLEMPDVGLIRCFSVETGMEIPVTLGPGESESIAVSTIQNHPNYTHEELELVQENETLIAQSLAQLQNKLEKLLSLASQDPETDRKLLRLALLLSNYNATDPPDKLQLTTSHICLLAAQLSAVNAATTQVNKRISGLSKSR